MSGEPFILFFWLIQGWEVHNRRMGSTQKSTPRHGKPITFTYRSSVDDTDEPYTV